MQRKFMRLAGMIGLLAGLMPAAGTAAEAFRPSDRQEFPRLAGPFLGQRASTARAELFAPGILSAGGRETRIVFSPDGMDLLYELSAPSAKHLVATQGLFGPGFLFYSRIKDGIWTEPEEFPAPSGFRVEYPFFRPDGRAIIFNSRGPDPPSPGANPSRLWLMERTEAGWGAPREVDFGPEYRGTGAVYPSLAANGNLYFAQFPDGVHGRLYISRFENGTYSPPEPLGGSFNDLDGNHPYIAPDERFIIFDAPGPGSSSGANDLYVSFREETGLWGPPRNLGSMVNTRFDERRAFVSADGRYLFFAGDQLNRDKPDRPLTLSRLRQLADQPADGESHIYWIDTRRLDIRIAGSFPKGGR
ncbi:MAG: PD40 domain-containing protein [Candidatus Aminicenantes bacterium]|nr:PD40 domain-containing protein [Candidatus Aminicenantes bacterium]